MHIVDLRSDTVTRPTPGMRRAIAEAEVGDDVLGEDPTVLRLEREAARRTGHEAALFVPTGSMGNQIAIHLHAPRGSDVIVDEGNHVYLYELGAMAAWSGVMPRVLRGEHGVLTPEQIDRAVLPAEYDLARPALLVLENTHNHAGGIPVSVERTTELVRCARRHGMRVHLDGARLFNAALALGVDVAELSAPVDSVSFCLSKGLGAPVGSVLCGSGDFVRQARIVRKRMGGGMRQVGILAAAGLYALEHHVERLRDDHRRAQRLARTLADSPCFDIDPVLVRTNIVVADVRPPLDRDATLGQLAQRGVLALAMGPGRIRWVSHLDVDDEGVERACSVLAELRPGSDHALSHGRPV